MTKNDGTRHRRRWREGSRHLPPLPPSVLILDDERDALERRSALLEEHYGARVTAASTVEEAFRSLQHERGLDLILADVNLEGSSSNDVSGADFAADAYELNPGIPIILYSGIFTEASALSDRHRSSVRSLIRKAGSAAELGKELDAAFAQAQQHRFAVTSRAEKILVRLREGVGLPLQDIIALKQTIGGALSDSTRERDLLAEGYEIDVADFEDRPSVVYWWRQSPGRADVVELEVFGHEYLRVEGEGRLTAVDRLWPLMDVFWESLGPPENLSGTSQRLHEFLSSYFEDIER